MGFGGFKLCVAGIVLCSLVGFADAFRPKGFRRSTQAKGLFWLDHHPGPKRGIIPPNIFLATSACFRNSTYS